ncbi:hypothetical protein PV327_006664 [Microctonus hyperodae]|uniref:DUF4802 domain-containing protein n=1 Tax=Microctonus hyperodae TaxID=165561 RepID=A0AA39KIJ6_MICHY|nr:hypothetical protein PV327_006664 [Microctonus hyperodae]
MDEYGIDELKQNIHACKLSEFIPSDVEILKCTINRGIDRTTKEDYLLIKTPESLVKDNEATNEQIGYLIRDLDTMLYGYTNDIYVLDHTPDSMPDMDMLQLFASPAGRALVTGDNHSRRRGTATSTSSLSRESSSRRKSNRRTSAMTTTILGQTSGTPSPPPQRQRKSSAELYKEAVEILGLTCSLNDSCRCIDCQSNYFDCDDDCGDARTELAAGTPILLDHALSHPLTCSIQ